MEIALLSLLAVRNCQLCDHYDGEGFCSLPDDDKTITGYIARPEQIACVKWTAIEQEDHRDPK